jgi:hypothetical protein
MQNNPNNQTPVASIVQENVPARSERMRSVLGAVQALGFVVSTSALTFGICVGATNGNTSQCVASPVIAAMVATPVIFVLNHFNSSLRIWQSEMNPVPSASLVANVNPTLVGITVSSGFPTAPELNSASGAPSPRASLYLEMEEESLQNRTNHINQIVYGNLVFPR